jgi:soluble lytic murein transglycosylase-like protein
MLSTTVVYADDSDVEELYNNWNISLKVYTAKLCREYDVSYSMVMAIIYNESRFQEDVVNVNANGTRDYGLMQINDSTYSFLSQEIGIEDMWELLDARTNILAGVSILKYHKGYTQDDNTALLRYQVGEGAYGKALYHPSSTWYQVLRLRDTYLDVIGKQLFSRKNIGWLKTSI